MAYIIADSDVLIDALRGREPMLSRIRLELRAGALATTVITVFELESGAKSAQEQMKVKKLLDALPAIPLDAAAARIAAAVRRDLEASGDAIGMADYLIAGICLSRSAILLTRNVRHFGRVRDLRLGTLSTP